MILAPLAKIFLTLVVRKSSNRNNTFVLHCLLKLLLTINLFEDVMILPMPQLFQQFTQTFKANQFT